MNSFEKFGQLNTESYSLKNESGSDIVPEKNVDELLPLEKDGAEDVKNKLISFVKYKSLKLKEYFGKLNQADFDALLDFEFEQLSEDNPPLDGVFDASEKLSILKKLPKDQRVEALDSFKEKLIIQKEALAHCRVFIEKNIEEDNDIPKERLMKIVDKFAVQYGFTDDQKKKSEDLIDNYYKQRQKVIEFRKSFPSDTEMISYIAGVEFKNSAKFDVALGPMSIDIMADEANFQKLFYETENLSMKNTTLGFASKKNDVDYTVLNTRSMKLLKNQNVYVHEQQHVRNKLFRQIFDKETTFEERQSALDQYESEDDLEIKKKLLEVYFLMKRQDAFNDVRDEIFAMKKDGSHSQLVYADFYPSGSGYDYLKNVRDRDDVKDDLVWQTEAEKILKDDYMNIIKKGLDSFDKLKEKGGYNTDEVIALLTDKSIPEWPKTVSRILEQKERSI